MVNLKSIDMRGVAQSAFDGALTGQQPAAREYVARLRRVHPDKTPASLTAVVNGWYLTVVTGSGAAAGAAAIVPNGWVQVPVALGDVAAFLEASVFYTLAVAEIHGVHAEDIERRRLLVMAVLMGDSAANRVLKSILGRSVPYWGKEIVKKVPMPAIAAANRILGPRFITKYGTTQGVLVLAKQVPLGIGVAVGAAGNHGFGWVIIGCARKMLGPSPSDWAHLDNPA